MGNFLSRRAAGIMEVYGACHGRYATRSIIERTLASEAKHSGGYEVRRLQSHVMYTVSSSGAALMHELSRAAANFRLQGKGDHRVEKHAIVLIASHVGAAELDGWKVRRDGR
jgi:hypothetical protein